MFKIRNIILSFIFLFLSFEKLSAQVSLKINLNHHNYLLYEPINVSLTMRNLSSQALIFGASEKLQGKISFEIEQQNSKILKPSNESLPAIKNLIIKPNTTQSIEIPLNEYYKFLKEGQYRIRTRIKHERFSKNYLSGFVSFNVTNGQTVWSRSVGIPDISNRYNDTPITTRKYEIVSVFDGDDKLFYLVIKDKNYVYLVTRIGYERDATRKPSCETDRMSRLHILHQIGKDVYSYFLYGVKGKKIKRLIYKADKTVPRLVRDPNTGKVVVAGGKKAVEGVDYVIDDKKEKKNDMNNKDEE